MTRRCSVMRMPVAAQRASIPVALSAGVDFSAVISGRSSWGSLGFQVLAIARSATARASRQVTAHQERVQWFPAGLLVIALAAPGDSESGPFVEPPCRLIIFLHFQEYRPHAAPGEMAKMCQQQGAGQATAAMAFGYRDRKYFGLVGSYAGHRKADDLPSH